MREGERPVNWVADKLHFCSPEKSEKRGMAKRIEKDNA